MSTKKTSTNIPKGTKWVASPASNDPNMEAYYKLYVKPVLRGDSCPQKELNLKSIMDKWMPSNKTQIIKFSQITRCDKLIFQI